MIDGTGINEDIANGSTVMEGETAAPAAFASGTGVSRRELLIGACVGAVASLSGLGTAPARAADKTIRIGLQPAPLLGYYVRDKKLLEKRGFKAEWTVFPFSPPILEAMVGGSIDVALLGVGPVLSTVQRNPGIWYFYDELANAAGLVVKTDSTIQGPKDLKGRKIAFPGKASQLYAQLAIYLKGSGVQPGDVDLVRANATDMTTLFKRGEVEGMLCWPPFTSDLVRTKEARKIFSADDLLKSKAGHWINSGWGVRAEYAKSNEDAVLAVVESLHEATHALRERPQEVYAVFAGATGYKPETVSFLVGEGFNAYFDPKDSAPSVKAMKEIYDVLEEHRIVRSDGPIEPALKALVHPEYVEKVLAKSK